MAAYHIRNRSDSGKPIWFDNGIRTHGSVDYMSIMRRQSHGCHRLHNHLAVRLFSTILKRRAHQRKGQTRLIYTRSFSRITSYNVCYTKLLRVVPDELRELRGRIDVDHAADEAAAVEPFDHFPRPAARILVEDPDRHVRHIQGHGSYNFV